MEPNEPPLLQELTASYRERGAAALDGFRGRPALVHCSLDKGSVAGQQFETVVASAPWEVQVAVAASRGASAVDPELLVQAGSVYTVNKRAGGPFPDRIGVGRSRSVDVSIRLASVSKYHAYFTEERSGEQITLWEARARNGTFVDGKRLQPGESAPLQNGTYLGFGEERFLFFTASGFAELVANLGGSEHGR